MRFERLALYFVPHEGELARFGASWLGWDAMRGQHVAHPDTALDLAEITQAPRKYGFHATVHWPFRLTNPESENFAKFVQNMGSFCTKCAPIAFSGLKLVRMGRFLALIPEGDGPVLREFAGEVVRAVEPWRRAPDAEEIARRTSANLSPRQHALLTRWGYPYVMDEFRFHMTLTGRLPKAVLGDVEAEVTALLGPALSAPVVLDALCVMGEDEDGMFHVIERLPLGGGS